MFDWDSRSVVRSLIGLFAFRSNPVSKVYQHRSRNDGILEVTWSTGSLRKNCKRHCCWGVNTLSIPQLANGIGPNRTRANESLLTYITSSAGEYITDPKKAKTVLRSVSTYWPQSKTVILSRIVDQKYLETEFSIAFSRPPGDN